MFFNGFLQIWNFWLFWFIYLENIVLGKLWVLIFKLETKVVKK